MVRFQAPLAALLACATPALAKGPMDRIFPSDGSCYLRHYDRSHMSKHQDQLVTDIAIGPYAPEWKTREDVVVTVMVSVRGTDEFFLANAYCKEGSTDLFCQMEGDAGAFTLTPQKGGKIMLSPTRAGMAFEGQSSFIALSGTSGDDRDFLMPPVPADSCP